MTTLQVMDASTLVSTESKYLYTSLKATPLWPRFSMSLRVSICSITNGSRSLIDVTPYIVAEEYDLLSRFCVLSRNISIPFLICSLSNFTCSSICEGVAIVMLSIVD